MSENGSPLVSVVTPFLNVSAYLAESIESVRGQTYPHWELLLCDDGSSDGGSDIARRYAALDPVRIRYLAHDGGGHRGASAARNLGLRAARGEYIALLDGDDVWFPDSLRARVDLLEERRDADAVYGAAEYWYGWTGAPEDVARDHVPAAGIPSDTLLAPHQLLTKLLRRELLAPDTCSVLMRAEAVRRTGGFVEEFRYIYTDQVFFAKLSLIAWILYVDQPWARYRRHEASAYSTVQRTGKSREARLRFLNWLRDYLAHHPAGSDPELRMALRMALRRSRHPRQFRLIDRLRNRLRARQR
jgi:glycosyltransferase involved in cell wall biosynthesis